MILDCVAVEAVGVLCRRRAERRDRRPFVDLSELFPAEALVWSYPLLRTWWREVIAEVVDSAGALNAHDALILKYARDDGAAFVATFDPDFAGRGVAVIMNPEDVGQLVQS